jgi:hypothetical protein
LACFGPEYFVNSPIYQRKPLSLLNFPGFGELRIMQYAFNTNTFAIPFNVVVPDCKVASQSTALSYEA